VQLLARAVVGGRPVHGEVDDDHFHVLHGGAFDDRGRTGRSLPVDDVQLLAPLDGVRFFNVMAGFVPPRAERPDDRFPWWLPKATRFPCGDGAEVAWPAGVSRVQIESELAVVVGGPLRSASPAEAEAAIFGWTVFNDLTAPQFGEALPFLWAMAKSIDGFTSWGPWIRRDLTEEQVMAGLAITAHVNGVQVQDGNTSGFTFTPSEMLSHISHYVALEPGDTVALGTPHPAPDVAVGDRVVCAVEQVGELHNMLVPESARSGGMQRAGS
jgi:2-keto-4-pentenoate hydratase/2-oxohepta-3-ene-1,7-dioic acid hydratase in catechol pathway